MQVAGGCLCGQLRYRFEGEPLYTGLCHCRDCKKTTGSAFAAYFCVQTADLTLTGIARASHATNGLGEKTRRNFCPDCGSTVYGGDPEDDTVNLYAGSFDDPRLFAPASMVYVKDRVAWAHVQPGTLPEHVSIPGHPG